VTANLNLIRPEKKRKWKRSSTGSSTGKRQRRVANPPGAIATKAGKPSKHGSVSQLNRMTTCSVRKDTERGLAIAGKAIKHTSDAQAEVQALNFVA